MLRKASLFLYALLLSALVGWEALDIIASYHSQGKPVKVRLSRDVFTLLEFRPSKEPRAVVVFCSGDGGWSGFEEEVSLTLQDHGYEVLGFNSNAYAATDYDLATLQADFSRIAQMVEAPYKNHPLPLIIGGWSMGAAQAIAAAGGPNPIPNLAGLLVLDPCSRGRYGLRLSDRSDFLPTGPGTFGMEEFARTMGNLHVVQWHADEDSIDSRAWLSSLTSPHKEFDFAKAGHYYSYDRPEFLHRLVQSVPWILTPEQNEITMTGSKK